MANYLISGWYGFNNLGDEAILNAMVGSITRELPGSDIRVLSFNPRVTTSLNRIEASPQLPHGIKSWVRSILRGDLLQTFNALTWCDVLILGGGGFLSDWQPEAPWVWLRQALVARMMGKKVMLYGIGAGPFTRPVGKWITKVLINTCVQAVTVRDGKSKEWLMECGVRDALIEVTADPAIGYMLSPQKKAVGYPQKVGICVAPIFHSEALWPGKRFKYNLYCAAIADIVRKLSAEGHTVTFIPMHESSDKAFALEILEDVPASVSIVGIPNEINNAVALLGGVDILIAMRLHAAILGAMQGVPVAGIIYHHKVAEFIEAIGMSEFSEELGDGSNWREADIDPERIVEKVKAIASDYEKVRSRMLAHIDLMKKKEHNNIRALKSLLEMPV